MNKFKKSKTAVAALAALAACSLFTGCATTSNSLYEWGQYDDKLYQSYAHPEKAEEFRLSLQAHINLMEASSKKVAPGLYAELGTLYLQSGDKKKALVAYDKERAAWPESRGLMDAMIKNLENMPSKATEKSEQPANAEKAS